MCINDSFLVDDSPPTTCVRSVQFSSFNASERLTLGELECSNLREMMLCCCDSNRLLSFICYSQIFLWFVRVDWGDVIVVEQTVDWMKRGKNVTSFFFVPSPSHVSHIHYDSFVFAAALLIHPLVFMYFSFDFILSSTKKKERIFSHFHALSSLHSSFKISCYL